METGKPDADARVEVNFDGLRNAITPINLMFDGRLFKDVKGLTAHITQAMKKVDRERPDFQGALIEINALEAGFNAAVSQWEQKLVGEIQRLKNSVVSAQQQSLGSTKKISKYQEELTRGKATTRSVPIRIGHVRNQLIHASGNTVSQAGATGSGAQSRLSGKSKEFPKVYKSAVAQILKKVSQRGEDRIAATALKIFKNLSRPLSELDERQEIHRNSLYYLPEDADGDDPVFQFVVIEGVSPSGDAYQLKSVLEDSGKALEMKFDEFHQCRVLVFEPLEDMEIILRLLQAKFRGDDFKETFKLYATIRSKAVASGRDEKFNPRQQEIHEYLTGLVFNFVGVDFDNRASEVRFTEQINNAVQIR